MGPEEAPGIESRVIRLEEAIGFGERSIEQLSAEIAEINARLRVLVRRMDQLDARVAGLSQPSSEEPDSPE